MNYLQNNGVYLDNNILGKLANNIYRDYRMGYKPMGIDFQNDYDTLKILQQTLPAGYYNLQNVPFPKIKDKSFGEPVDIQSILMDWNR